MATDEEIQQAIDNDPALNKKRWQNRRRMAWLSLISMTIITYLILFTNLVPNEKMKILGDVITWYYFCSVSVVGAYMGVTAWTTKK
jgi:branched-subunit amino acid transport protein